MLTLAQGQCGHAATVLFCEGNTDGTVGGSYFSLLYLVEGLRGTRFEPIVVFYREHALLPYFSATHSRVVIMERPTPIRLLPLAPPRGHHASLLLVPLLLLQRLLNLARFLAAALRCARFLKLQRVALLHLNNSVTRSHDWMLAAWLTRTPCIVHERGINDRFPFLAKLLAPRLSAVICISEAVRDNLRDHGITRSNLRVIENGLDPARVAPRRASDEVRRTLGIAPGTPVVGLVGNIKEWKGQEVVVRALPGILERVPDVVCLFVGVTSEADRYYLDRLRELIAQLRIEAHVVFTGYCENVADYLNVMDLVIHASIEPEPFGRVLLEAMSMKKPVVASRAGAVPEIVEHGVTGYTFAPGDPGELGVRVSELLVEPATARAFGEAGYARLLERFTITRNVSRTLELYEEILAGRRQRTGAAMVPSRNEERRLS